jgi:hypothetical protein
MRQQRRQRRLDGEGHPVEQHVHRIAIRRGLIGQVVEDRRDPGAGQHEVEASQFGNAVVDDGPESVHVTDVGLLCDDAPSGLLDQIDGFIEILAGAIGDPTESICPQMSTAMMLAPPLRIGPHGPAPDHGRHR